MRKQRVRALGALLAAPCAIGLLPDRNGDSAVTAALDRDFRPAMRALLPSNGNFTCR